MFDKKIIIGTVIGALVALIAYNMFIVKFIPAANLEDSNSVDDPDTI
jgi:hypothetical protein